MLGMYLLGTLRAPMHNSNHLRLNASSRTGMACRRANIVTARLSASTLWRESYGCVPCDGYAQRRAHSPRCGTGCKQQEPARVRARTERIHIHQNLGRKCGRMSNDARSTRRGSMFIQEPPHLKLDIPNFTRNYSSFRASSGILKVAYGMFGTENRFGTAVGHCLLQVGPKEFGDGPFSRASLPSVTVGARACHAKKLAKMYECLLRCAAHLLNACESLCQATELVPAALYDVLLLAGKLHQIPLEGSTVVVELRGCCSAHRFVTALRAQYLRATRRREGGFDSCQHHYTTFTVEDERQEAVTTIRAIYNRLCVAVRSQDWALSGEHALWRIRLQCSNKAVFLDGQDCTRNKLTVQIMFSNCL